MPDTLITGFYSDAGTPLEIWSYNPSVFPDPDPATCSYTHFDLTTENLGHTQRYNCWAFTFLPRRYWFSRAAVDTVLQDNCDPVADGSIELGDIIRYQNGGITSHTGRVWQVDGAGHATLIRSKWGPSAEYIHTPLNVPVTYGTELAYFRQRAPLKGDPLETNKIADIWIKDSPSDNGEQGRRAPWWTSPDILVDAYPFDGTPDINPVFDNVNRVWSVIRNRTNQHVDNVYVRFYWADPAAGLPAASWNLIPATPGHPNPVGPISIDGYSSVETDYVEWTPTAAPAHQCLLAIAYINDDPKDSNNPDPIVYPFEIPWDNNIGQRNVHVKELEPGSNGEFSIRTWSPFHKGKEVQGSIDVILTYSPMLPIFGFPKRIRPLKISVVLDKTRRVSLKPLRKDQRNYPRFIPDDRCHNEKAIAGAAISKLSFSPKKAHRLDVKVSVPKDAVRGSIYNLHISQSISGMITGGYTAVVLVK
jgi:hypothetical protein